MVDCYKVNRKFLVIIGIIFTLYVFACSPVTSTPIPTLTTNTMVPSQFVTAQNGKIILNERSYYFIGANFWQGLNLGMDGLARRP
jgi:mannan endo-1,4-beta-mannosidase